MDQILAGADRMQILIGYVKIDTVKDKLNGYTYITFYFIYNNIKCVNTMILLSTYQCFHRIHCHSTSIAMDYTTSGAKCQFRCHDCVKILKISCATLARIGFFLLLLFTN